METELHTEALVGSSSTVPAALGMAGTGGSKGVRSRTAGAAAVGSGGRGEGAGAGAEGEAGDAGKHHSGLLSETDDSRSRSRGAKVGRLDALVKISPSDEASIAAFFRPSLLRRPTQQPFAPH